MNKKSFIILSIIIIFIVLALGMSLGILYSNKDVIFSSNKDIQNTDKVDVKVSESNSKNVEESMKSVDENTSKESTIKDENTSKEDTTINENTKEEVTYTEKDNIVISEMESTLNSIDTLNNDDNLSDKAKATFVSIVDFLFYDGKIKDVTFDELTTSGKEKVLELASKIDEKLEEKAPGYKDSISANTKEAYNKASEVIKIGANNINDFAKEKLGDENYNLIIDAKDELVKYSKNAFSLIKDSSSNLLTSAKDKLTKWYQNFKNN